MKKLATLLVIALMTSLSFFANGEFNEEENNNAFLIVEAKIALATCANYHEQPIVTVENGEECRNGRSTTTVTLWSRPICPPGYMCAQFIRKIGTVTFDCDNNIIDVNCQ